MDDLRQQMHASDHATPCTGVAFYVERATSVLTASGALLALLALADLAVRATVRLDLWWDTFWYHLPFAALRGGLGIPYEMSDTVQGYYQGFPPLPHLAQGVLWRLTGSINATGVVNYLAFLVFVSYCRVALKATFWLVALIALTAPMVLIHTTTSIVDLFANSWLAIGISSCLYLYLFPQRSSRAVLPCGLGGLIGAAWSKYQLVPLVVVVWCLLAGASLRSSRRNICSPGYVVLLLLAAALLASLPYLKNFAVYGNPFWPIRLPVMAESVPYEIDPIADAPAVQRPPPLRDYSQAMVFVHSLLEIGHPTRYSHRPRWTIDQSQAWIAYRAGGFWGVGVVVYLSTMMIMFVVHDRKSGMIAIVVTVGTLCFVAVLPASNELRYYMFIPLSWAAAIGMLFPRFRELAPLGALALLMMVTGLFSYMVYENQVYYRIERTDYLAAAQAWGAVPWWSKLERGPTYCVVDMLPLGMLMTGPTMSEYSIVDRSRETLCPEGSVLVTKQGIQHVVHDTGTNG